MINFNACYECSKLKYSLYFYPRAGSVLESDGI